eukprot:TRINITY_DN4104_c2_g1_i1.p1 TRINITY_DN4104_c2_g1~~TRINITY_DN4104_c2_g1_i1.p1  ORF type:complete len:322 (+),score=60.42 TRINITY_DN4104_c2_g1_i1:74-967(+)
MNILKAFVIAVTVVATTADFVPGHILVCSQHSHCQKYGDSAGRCNDLTGQCVCGVGFTGLQLGTTPSSVYPHCFPNSGGDAARASSMTSIITLTFGTADCSKIPFFENEFRSIVATALEGTSVSIIDIIHTCLDPEDNNSGLYTAIQVEGVINDFTPGSPLMILPRGIQELIDKSTVSSLRLDHQRFENLVELDGAGYSCVNGDGTTLQGWYGSNICKAISCSENYKIEEGSCSLQYSLLSTGSSEELNGGEIAGIVIGVIAFVVLFIVVIFYMCYPKKDTKHIPIDGVDKTIPDKQ